MRRATPKSRRTRRHLLEFLESRLVLDSTVVFNEIMYHPAEQPSNEWIELQNQMVVDIDLSGWSLSGGVDYTFAEGARLGGGQRLVIAADPVALRNQTGLGDVFGPFTGNLSNGGESLELRNRDGRTMDQIDYDDEGLWPIAADGSGASLAKREEQSGSLLPENWTSSAQVGGTPGAVNFPSSERASEHLTLIPLEAEWRNIATASPPPAAWSEVGFEDAAWESGGAILASENVSLDFAAGHLPQVPPVASLPIANSGFEDQQNGFGGGGNYYSDIPQWNDPVAGSAGVGSRLNHTSAWLNGMAPPQGEQVAFIQGGGSFRQSISGFEVGQSYVVTYYENERGLSDGVYAQTSVILGGQEIVSPHVVTNGAWRRVRSQVFTATATSHELEFQHLGGLGDNTALFDEVAITRAGPIVANGGFETPDLSPNGFAYNPAASPWTHVASGVSHNGGGFMNGGVTAPEGRQVAFLQQASSIEQVVSGLEVGARYSLSWFQQARLCCVAPHGNDLTVSITDTTNHTTLLFDKYVFDQSWQQQAVEFTAADSAYTIRLQSTNLLSEANPGVDRSLLIDDVRVDLLAPPPAINTILPATSSTRYFRREFNFDADPALTQLWLNTILDDGAVIHVNGVEVARRNMPEGVILPTTPADMAIASAAFSGPWEVSAGSLRQGLNVLAVELHQAADGDGDSAFGLELSATVTEPDRSVTLPSLAINEIAASSAAEFTVELVNHGQQPIELEQMQLALSDKAISSLPSISLPPGQFLTLSQDTLGFAGLAEPGDSLFLFGPEKATVIDAGLVRSTAVARAPDATGNWLVVETLTPGAPNIATVRDEIVINEIMYHNAPDHSAGGEENTEEWIEIFNRGAGLVDLTGWSLREAVEYEFAPGTTLGPGEFLVIARDAAALSAAHPEINAVGNFRGRLRDSSERLLLLDDRQNPADEVRYYENGRWPEAADGGGSSLELRDPDADNSRGESWAASLEAPRSDWRSYTYRGLGGEPPGNNNPEHFEELIIGLLDAGQVLLDDIRVVEDPEGAARELMQNGGFQTDAIGGAPDFWRLLGTHSRTQVIVDPSDAANRVLHVIASGPADHMHNHLETTLAAGAAIVPGREYDISFRAKWISGSPQVNTRLYFNQLARTTIIDVPSLHGTPGASNSQRVENAGPVYDGIRHAPLVPQPDEAVTVFTRVEDSAGLSAVTLWYSVNDGPWLNLPMEAQAEGRYNASIPGQSAAAVVQFYVEGADGLGQTSTFPAAGRDSRALFRVAAGDLPAENVHQMRLIMTSSDADRLHTNSNVMSNDLMGATVIYNDREVFYDVGVRLRASGYGRQGGLAGFHLDFHEDHLFRDVHRSIAIDRGVVVSNGDGSGIRGVPGASPHELLFNQIAQHAGSIPAMYDDVVYIEAPRQNNTGLAQLKLARYTDVFLDSAYRDGSDGSLFKFELIYYATNTVDGNPQSIKTAPNAVKAVDIRDMGDNKESYRLNFLPRNNRDRDDYEGLIELSKVFSLQGQALNDGSRQLMDVDQWMRLFALYSLTGVADSYNMGLAHNIDLYQRPSDNRMLVLPWDFDHGFFYAANSPILGRGGSNLAKIIALPQNTRLFHGHLLDLIQRAYNTTYLTPWIEHYSQITQQDLAPFFANYIDGRASYVMQQLSLVAPEIPFQVTSNGGMDFAVADQTVEIRGEGWIDVREIRLRDNAAPLPVTWIDGRNWRVTVPLTNGENVLAFEAFDFQGNLTGSDSIVVTSSAATPSLPDALRVTELMYNPHASQPGSAFDNDDFEFIELTNTASSPVRLFGAQFTRGVSFVFGDVRLDPGASLVVVKNEQAFLARYGAGIQIAGEFASGSLDNGGETLELVDSAGSLIAEFRYDDEAGWPGRADGNASSLEPIDLNGDLNDSENWRASTEFGGSPGRPGLGEFRDVVVNEVLSHTDPPQVDAIELLNLSPISVDIGGWYLSDSNEDYFKFQIPLGTMLDAGAYLVFDERHFNAGGGLGPGDFALDGAHGDDVWLLASDAQGAAARFADRVQFDAQANGQSWGRWPNGVGALYPTDETSLGGENQGPYRGNLVISEIMYNPPDPDGVDGPIDPRQLEFLEILNSSSQDVDLTDWNLAGGVDFEFPAGALLPASATLVVLPFAPDDPQNAQALADFVAFYPVAGAPMLVGGYDGQLDNGGESLRLFRPDEPPADEPNFIPRLLEDEVRYDNLAPWPTEADGGGSSLRRGGSSLWGNEPSNWGAASPSPGLYSPLAPRVMSTKFNADILDPDDLPHAAQPTSWQLQRSRLRAITVTFSHDVVLSASDLRLTNLGVNVVFDADQEVVIREDQLSLLGNQLRITFAENELASGVYGLEIASSVTDLNGNSLDGDGDGLGGDDYVLQGNAENRFYQLAGDWNGDGGVTIFDFPSFAYWFGLSVPAAPAYIDLNHDDGVSIFDFPAFAANFGSGVVFATPGLVAENANSDGAILRSRGFLPTARGLPVARDALRRSEPARVAASIHDQALTSVLAEWSRFGSRPDIARNRMLEIRSRRPAAEPRESLLTRSSEKKYSAPR